MTATVQLALCTCPDPVTAERLAESLIQSRLAACINLVPGLVSVYSWEGAVARDEEVLLVIKTTDERIAELIAHIEQTHPYDLPEVIALPVVAGLDSYLEWIGTCTTTAK